MKLALIICPRGHEGRSVIKRVVGIERITAKWEKVAETEYLEPQPFAPGNPIVGVYHFKCNCCDEEFSVMELRNGDII